MADADELLRAGDLNGARASLIDQVKRAPSDQKARLFLLQLQCLSGEWDKAQAQLRTLASLSPEAQMLAVTYNAAIDAERERTEAFAGRAPPALLVKSSAWAGDLAAALAADARGQAEDAEAKRQRAFDTAPDTPGEIDGVAFDYLADGDARFGPALEAIVAGRWGLVPFDSLESVKSEGPRDLRDLVWLPAQLAFKTGQSVNALLPTRYPGSESTQDAALRLARVTEWVDAPWGARGIGQHEWTLSGGEDVGILSLRTLHFH